MARLFKRLSPFEFATLKECPWPTWAVLFTALFLYLIVWQVWYRFDYYTEHAGISRAFVLNQLDPKTRQDADIIVLGDSTAGSIVPHILENRTGRTSFHLNWPMSTPWAAYRVFEKFERFVGNPRIIMINLASGYHDDPKKASGRAYARYHILKYRRHFEFLYRPYDKKLLSWSERIFPTRVSLPELVFSKQESWLRADPIARRDPAIFETQRRNWPKQLPGLRKRTQPKLIKLFQPSELSYTNMALLEEIEDIADRCRAKGILLVLNETAYIEPFAANNDPVSLAARERRKNWFSRLKGHKNIVLVENDEYHPHLVGIPGAILTPDGHHMNLGGAVLYTNWLCNKLLSDPKVCSHLRRPMNMLNDKVDLNDVIAQWSLKSSVQVASPQAETKVR